MDDHFAKVKSSDFLESVIDNLPGYVYRVRNDDRWSPVYISPNIKKITGYSVDDFANSKGKLYDRLIHPEDRERVLNVISECLETGRSFQIEYRIIAKDNKVKWVWEQAKGVFDEDGNLEFLEGYVSDVSDRKELEREKQDILERYQRVTDNVPGFIFMYCTRPDGSRYMPYASEGIKSVYGINPEDVLTDATKLYSSIHPEDLDSITNSTRGADGEALDWAGEFRVIKPDGRTIWVGGRSTASLLHDGTEIRYGYLSDITESKSAQEESKTLLKITTEQNKRLKNFAHIVSHNLRSHSGNFLMMLELIDEMHPGLKSDEIIQNIRLAANDLQKTINHLNEVVLMTASGDIGMVRVGLHSHIESAIQNVAFLAKDVGVEIINDVPKATGVKGIPAYVDSILINFISNAIKYRDPVKKSFVRLFAEFGDNTVLLKIADNGLGIDLVANEDRMFGMFKTFHDNKDSRGLGLFMARNQIEALGGDVSVESEVGVGTTFTVKLYRA